MNKYRGFTLLEVLVASLILAMAISIASLAYQTGLTAERVAEKKVYKASVLRFIKEAIVEEIRKRPDLREGEGDWGSFSYQWTIQKRFEKWSKSGFDLESNTNVEMGRKLQLLSISLDVDGEEYEFTHLAWK